MATMRWQLAVQHTLALFCSLLDSSHAITGWLVASEQLRPRWSRLSNNGKHMLKMESDGSFCSYYNNIETWCVHSNGRSIDRVEMQADGNLVIHDTRQRSVWSTGTWQYRGQNPALKISDDGNMEIWTGLRNDVLVWQSRVRRFRYVQFVNGGTKDRSDLLNSLILYPLVMNLDTNAEVWNGKSAGDWPYIMYPQYGADRKTVDFRNVQFSTFSWRTFTFKPDPEQNALKQPVHLGFYVQYGDNQWAGDWRFIYDPNCTATQWVWKLGGFHSGYVVYDDIYCIRFGGC